MLSSNTYNRLKYGLANPQAADEIVAALSGISPFGRHLYVDASITASGDGTGPDVAFSTMAEAFSVLRDNDVVHLRGPISETLTCPDGITGVTIIGDGAGLRHGSTTNVAEGYAASWHDDSAAPLVQVHSQGWTFANILFAPNSADSAIELLSDGTQDPEHTVSGFRVIGCRFAGGAIGIEDNGGAGYVTIAHNLFEVCTTAAIKNVSTANAGPSYWQIYDNTFNQNATHIDAPLTQCYVWGNRFGLVPSTGLYVDLTDGNKNMVAGNWLAGTYNTSDYVAGTSDLWLGNWVTVVSTQAPNGFTIAVPAA